MGSATDSSKPLPTSPLDYGFTELIINSMGPKTSPRMREVMTNMIKHVHAFAKESNLTVDEWQAGMALLNQTGAMSNDRVNHMQILMDCIGVETIVDAITHKQNADTNDSITPMAVLGPMFRDDAPVRENGSSMVVNDHDGQVTYMYGKVIDCVTQKPVKNASIQIWQASSNGLYDQEDPGQMTGNLRGVFKSDDEGRYSFYCLKPTPYPIPEHCPAATFLNLMDRSHYRPAHIHAIVSQENYTTLTTQIYSKDDPYLEIDASCAVVTPLVVEFVPCKSDAKAELELEFNFTVAPRK